MAQPLTAATRRQYEHRRRTADRLTALLRTGPLDSEFTALALCYRAKDHKDLGRAADARRGMRHVAATDGRLAPGPAAGFASLDRISDHSPAAPAPDVLRDHGPRRQITTAGRP